MKIDNIDVICEETRDGIFYFYHDLRSRTIFHKTDGPAITNSDGHQEWWLHGSLHRIDGPAVIKGNIAELWVEGKWIRSIETFKKLSNMSDQDLLAMILAYDFINVKTV